uniref:Uncharacterized protein n=1 Tax=Rhizophora mucronata TaxID=61149 RepID=A0A2P2QE89_RHIMU
MISQKRGVEENFFNGSH